MEHIESSTEEMLPATIDDSKTFFDIKESLLFEDIPDNEDILQKFLHQVDRNSETTADNQNSAPVSVTECDIPDAPFVVSYHYSRPKLSVSLNGGKGRNKSVNVRQKFRIVPYSNKTKRNLQRCLKTGQKKINSLTNSTANHDAGSMAEALWHAKNLQPRVLLTDIFKSSDAAKHSLYQIENFLKTSEIIEKNVADSGCLEIFQKPKTSARRTVVRNAVVHKLRSPTKAFSAPEAPKTDIFESCEAAKHSLSQIENVLETSEIVEKNVADSGCSKLSHKPKAFTRQTVVGNAVVHKLRSPEACSAPETDIFESSDAAKHCLSQIENFLETNEIVEKNVADSRCLEVSPKPKTSARQTVVRNAVVHELRSPTKPCSAPDVTKKDSLSPKLFKGTLKPTKIDPAALKSKISHGSESSSIAVQEASKVKPGRSRLSFMDMIKKYSEKSPQAQTLPLIKESPLVENGVNDQNEVVIKQTLEESLEVSKSNSSYTSPKSISFETLNDVTQNSLSDKIIKENGETNINVSSEVMASKSVEKDSSCGNEVQKSVVSKHLNHQNGSADFDCSVKKPLVVNSEITNRSVVSYRMQTRMQTNSVVVKNAKDLLNGKISLWNKTEKTFLKSPGPKPTVKNVRSFLTKNNLIGSYCYNSNGIKKDTSTAADKTCVGAGRQKKSSPSGRRKRISSADKTIHADSKINESFSLSMMSRKINGVNPFAELVSDHELNNGDQSGSDSFDSEEKSLPNIDFPVIEPQQPQASLPNIFKYTAKPICINPNSAFLLGNSFVQVPSPGNQNMFPAISQLAVQQQKPFSFPQFPLSSFNASNSCVTYPIYATRSNVSLRPQANFIYPAGPNVNIRSESNVLTNNEMNVNGASNRPFVPSPSLNPFPSIPVPAGGNKLPIIVHTQSGNLQIDQSSTGSTHTYTNTETVDTILSSKQLKEQGFLLIKNISESARKLCIYDISDFALRFFTEKESFSNITVKEFYLRSPLVEILRLKVSEATTEFDDTPKIEYIFENNFEEKSLRDVVKDYVTFHLDAIYKHPASKDYFVRKTYRYFPFRDCSFLCESLPKDNEDLNHKDIILFLSCSALLVLYDECKKRNIL